ncbi:MAG TPA: hypothetical protein VJQ51_15405 [Burkholderiales bacterium]|nr:hypothetical protein [Burkholderiales bacterium]
MNFGWASAGKAALVAAALAALVLTGTEAWAKGGSGGRGGGGGRASHSGSKSGSHHHHHRGSRYSHSSSSGVFFYGSYFAFPAYWFASAPGLPREPVYYIERSEEELRSSSMWYYCESEAAYYPYVSQCPAGWVQVEPFALP